MSDTDDVQVAARERELMLLVASNIIAGMPRNTSPDFQVNLSLEMAMMLVARYDQVEDLRTRVELAETRAARAEAALAELQQQDS